jgi:hypothetical protein
MRGPGLEAAEVVPLVRAREARRLDLRAALRDPFEGWWVREYQQRSAIRVVLLVDASASMEPQRALVTAFARAFAEAALRAGDALGLVAYGDTAHAAPPLPPTRVRHAVETALEQALGAPFRAPSAAGLAHAAHALPRQASLVLLVSDFLGPVAALDAALGALARHDVVPVWVGGAGARRTFDDLPAFGLLPLRDAESGRERLLWLRPALRRRWQARQAAHHAEVRAVLARHRRQPLELAAPFDADVVTRHFVQRG